MKLLPLTTICCVLASSFLSAESFAKPFSPKSKSHIIENKDSRSHEVTPAYIVRYYTGPEIDISASGTLVPLGNIDGGISPVLLRYNDTGADKFVRVRHGGAGKYLIQYSIFATFVPWPTPPLILQLQVDHGSGYDSSIPQDFFEPILNELGPQYAQYQGTAEAIVSLKAGDKIHLAVIQAAPGTTIGKGIPLQKRFTFTMHRIDS